ncbi:hypothetical protein pipiens_007658 [Culex pipiens pipiens]|uniref:Uncharacterized protein n=1 Tax=Culex pipiens pipiens TaxID=38569 RepID=A0ABD1DKS1_CULPP
MSSDDEHYQLLQTAKFSIRSPRARVAKRVQQELIRAGERRQRRAPAGKMPVMRPRRQEAHKYLPQCDQVMQNAVDLYIASQLQRKAVIDQRQYDEVVRGLTVAFFQQPPSVQAQYLKASVLPQPRTSPPCSDPFLLFLELHRKQTQFDRHLRDSQTGSNIDIGSAAINAERAETGVEPDETRLHLLTWKTFVADARTLWRRMRPDLKLPFYVQAYVGTHFPESMDAAI